VADYEWRREEKNQGHEVIERSATRQQLERSIRSMLPDRLTLGRKGENELPTAAAAGVGGLFTGYVWGWIRGRRSRPRRGN
jgi:hypothetical protein